MTSCLQITSDYRTAGLSVLPADVRQKRPAVPSWKAYQKRLPTTAEIEKWFSNERALCLVTGATSGNLEMIDFDCQGVAFPAWQQLVEDRVPGLITRLVIEQSPSGGWHVVYRCESLVCGNIKLAERAVVVESGDEVELHGKKYKPRKVGDRWEVQLTLIETRGEGGIFLCHPTPGYQLVQGQFIELPILTDFERETLLEIAWSLDELKRPVEQTPTSSCGRPGDDFNQFGDVRSILCRHGWTLVRGGKNEYWRRPGKTEGWSATLKDGVFYVFSSSAAPFEPNQPYSPFAVFSLLEHGGDFSNAATALRAEGFGSNSGISILEPELVEDAPRDDDPGPIPDELLYVPGFVDDVMQYTLDTAPYPERALAFAGALGLQGLLAGRKVRDVSDNRTNLYLIALANPGVGKDHPRKVNQRILLEAGMPEAIGDTFASGEGIQDRMFATPQMLFQTDEVDGMTTAINVAKDARHEGIMNVLLKMYSSANSLYPMRVRAGREHGVIDQPCLCVFGTAVPKHFYESLTVKMLTNGFVARFLVVESRRRGRGRDGVVRDIPERIVEVARWWVAFQPGEQRANLQHWHPLPRVVQYATEASRILADFRDYADDQYSRAEDKNEPAAMAIWSRANEKARRLALIFACSANHESPGISAEGAAWARAFVDHQTRRMLFMAGRHVSENEFDAKCKRLVEVLAKWREKKADPWMPFWMINRKLPWSQREHEEVRQALENQKLIDYRNRSSGGRSGLVYRLLGPT